MLALCLSLLIACPQTIVKDPAQIRIPELVVRILLYCPLPQPYLLSQQQGEEGGETQSFYHTQWYWNLPGFHFHLARIAEEEQLICLRDSSYQTTAGLFLHVQNCREDLRTFPRLEESLQFVQDSTWYYDQRCFISSSISFFTERRKHYSPIRADLEDAILSELQRRYRIYDALEDAANPNMTYFTRRSRLNDLKCILGARDFYAGRFPAPVPVELYQEVGR